MVLFGILIFSFSVKGQSLVQIGNNTAQQSANFGPLHRLTASHSHAYSHYVYLYEASELALPVGAVITGIDWQAQAGTGGLSGPNVYNIYMGTTSQTSIAITGNNFTAESAGTTTVFQDSNYQLPQGGGWISHQLDVPFTYTGNNLKILTQHHKTGTASGGILFHYESKPGKAAGVSGSANNAGTAFASSRSNSRPNVRIHYLIPGIDAAIQSIASPIIPIPVSSTVPVVINITNGGATTVTGASVGYIFNNGTPVIESWSGSLTGGSVLQHTFSTPITTQSSGSSNLKVWISNPNNAGPDFNTSNDTSTLTICTPLPAGNYTIGGATADFTTLTAAIDYINCGGISGPVQFTLASGIYTGNFEINNLAFGVSLFSASGLAEDVIITHNGSGTVFSINAADNVVISGITFKRTNTALGSVASVLNTESAISVSNSRNFTLANCYLEGPVGNPVGTPASTSSNNQLLTVLNCDNASIINNRFTNGYYGLLVRSQNGQPNFSLNIADNDFLDIYHTPILVQQKYNAITIDRNFFESDLTNVAGDGSFVRLDDVTGCVVSNNKSKGKTGTYCFYIRVSGDSSANNIVYNNELSAQTVTQVYGASPLRLEPSPGTEIQIVYNSFHLIPDLSRGGGAEVYALSGGITTIFKNNVFSWFFSSAPPPDAAVFQFVVADTNFYTGFQSVISENNSFYSNYGTISLANNPHNNSLYSFAVWQTQFGKDLNSITANPRFTANDSLRPMPGSPLTGAAAPIASITTDIAGTIRDTANPCIGAFEVEPVLQFDIFALEIASPVQAHVPNGSSQTVALRFINHGYDTLSAANLHYQLNNGPVVTEAFSGLLLYQDTTTFTFVTPVVLPASGLASFKVWTSNPNGQQDQNTAADTLEYKFCLTIPTGTYTFGGPLTDFPDVSELSWVLSCAGVNGPVTFKAEFPNNVLNEQLVLNAIPGTGPGSRVRFEGQGDTISFDPSNNNKAVVELNDVSYVNLEGFYIHKASTNTKRGHGIMLVDASHNIIRRNTVDVRNSSYDPTFGNGITLSKPSAFGGVPTTSSYNIIDSNIVIGGGAGIALAGDTVGGENQCIGNLIADNDISDFFWKGIHLSNTDSTIVDGNNLHRPTRADLSTFDAILIQDKTRRSTIRNNRIHNSFPANGMGNLPDSHGINYSATPNPGEKNVFYNNVIYNLVRPLEGTAIGIAIGGSNADFHHNTIAFTYQITSRIRPTIGIAVDHAQEGITIQNNNVFIDEQGINEIFGILADTSSVFSSNNNNIYLKHYTSGTQSLGGIYDAINVTNPNLPTFINLVSYPTLSGWQTATGQDAGSFSINPDFIQPANGDYIPNNPALDNRAVPVTYITTDILAAPRNPQNPDIGAYEFCPMNGDSATIGICAGTSYIFGSQTLTTAGIYTEVFSNTWGCDSTVTLTLSVDTAILMNATVTICQGSTYTFGTQTLTTAGTYNHTFQSIGGCDSTVTLELAVSPTHSSTTSATICQGSIYILGTQVLTSPGTFSHTFQNIFGCDSVVTLNLSVTPVDTSVTVNGLTLTANALNNSSYQWLNCTTGIPITGAINRNYNVSANGSYALITTQNGCADTSDCYTFINVGVKQRAGLKAHKLYPNPTQGVAYLSFEQENAEPVIIRVMDTRGREVFYHKVVEPAGNMIVELPLEILSEGVYSVLLESATGGRAIIKLVKTK